MGMYCVYTCDDVNGPIVEIFNYFETSGGQAAIVFSSDPVNCGDFDSKKECRKSKDCNGILIKGLVYQASADQLLNLSNLSARTKQLHFRIWRIVQTVLTLRLRC